MTVALMKIAAGNAILHVAGHTFAEFCRDGRRTAREAQLVRQWRPEIIPVTADEGILAGQLLGQSGGNNAMDAIVVATAALHGITEIYTTDADDLIALRGQLPDGTHHIAIVDAQ